MTPCTLIIGYGSDLRGDDALGQKAAVMLDERLSDPCVCVLRRASLTPELAHDVSLADRVIFIDCDANLDAGQIERRAIKAKPDADAMVHFLDPPALLGWARLLYGAAPPGVLFAMGGATFECADDLSEQIEQRLPQLVNMVLTELASQPHQKECSDA